MPAAARRPNFRLAILGGQNVRQEVRQLGQRRGGALITGNMYFWRTTDASEMLALGNCVGGSGSGC